MKIDIIAGARPNFMKVAPIIEAIEAANSAGAQLSYRLVHTGQHYDKVMSENFFTQLGIPEPHINLECGGGSQAEQTANIMVAFEKELMQYPADMVLVVGDVTSTMACSIVAKKQGIKVAHVEAGIRSFDLTMPEEINRMVTDSIADYFFTTSKTANENLVKIGMNPKQIFFVGNTMIDTLLKNMKRLQVPKEWNELNLKPRKFFLVTLHRPANVDEATKLKSIVQEIANSVDGLPVIFPVHPRTAKIIQRTGIEATNLHLIEPLGYLEFNYLVSKCLGVITDSGGVTEETTVLNIPCLTLRNNTERPETVELGSNELIGTDSKKIKPALRKILDRKWKKSSIPELWDGKTSKRIVVILQKISKDYFQSH